MDQQQSESGHVSLACEKNSRGYTFSAKVIIPVVAPLTAGATPLGVSVELTREIAQEQIKAAMAWLEGEYGAPVTAVKDGA